MEYHNANRDGRNVGDCTVRAISVALDQEWDTTYWGLCVEGWLAADMPSGNRVWGRYLSRRGWERSLVDTGMSVRDFAATHPDGTYLLALDTHVVACVDGAVIDTWDSGKLNVIYVWEKG